MMVAPPNPPPTRERWRGFATLRISIRRTNAMRPSLYVSLEMKYGWLGGGYELLDDGVSLQKYVGLVSDP